MVDVFAPNTAADQIDESYLNLKNGKTLEVSERKALLKKLKSWLTQNEHLVLEALKKDFNKPEVETIIGEIYGVTSELNYTLANLKEWSSPKRVSTPITLLGTFPKIVYEPKGLCLIMSPWNYPFNLAIKPMIQAIGAGNRVLLKPSEVAPSTSSLIASMMAEVCAPDQVSVVQGDASVSQLLLNNYRWDHIFFTGSPGIGKVVMAAAAKHLTSVTLELGGKSPCIVDETANVVHAAERMVWGKFVNNGQTCIAPDYVFVHQNNYDQLLNEIKRNIAKMYGGIHGEAKNSASYARIINSRHVARLKGLLDDALEKGARIECGGVIDDESNFISPTILVDIKNDMRIMTEEIFGPLLPIIPYSEIDQVLEHIASNEKPLALYHFTSSNKAKNYINERSTAGGALINDCLLHYGYPGLPFGGVNNSGIGKSSGHFGFLEFSNQKAVVEQKLSTMKMLYPPYTDFTKKLIKFMMKLA